MAGETLSRRGVGMSAWVFIDLDGTLTNAEPGITRAIAHALRKSGLPVPPQADLAKLIGPALQETFPKLGVTDIDAALGYYRELYTDKGLYEAEVYEGAHEMMARLRDMGFRLSLATAKPIVYARRITDHFEFSPLLDAQHGSELDGARTDKRDLIAHIIAETGADPAKSFMLGDRMHDARGAIHNGVTPLGALWGFGSEAELREIGVSALAKRPVDIPELVETLR